MSEVWKAKVLLREGTRSLVRSTRPDLSAEEADMVVRKLHVMCGEQKSPEDFTACVYTNMRGVAKEVSGRNSSRFQLPTSVKMRVKHNPDFNIDRFEEAKYKDFRWWYNEIFPQIRSKDWVDVETLRVRGATQDEVRAAVRKLAGLGMWFYMTEG